MSPPVETLLSTLPASENDRLAVVLVQSVEFGSRVELRQQSYSQSIGWFTQSTVTLEPSQVAALRNALGSGSGRTASSGATLPRAFTSVRPATWQPRVVAADSA
jgi:hypothetical protein